MRASVVICVRNRPIDVRRCVESLLQQTCRDFEIVLVDDGSTDETPAVLESLQRENSELTIRVVRNHVNLGVSGARNAGIHAATTDRVLFIDSDCVADPNWVDGLCRGLGQGVSAVSGTVLEPPAKSWADRAFFGGLRVGLSNQGRPLAGCNMGFQRKALLQESFDPVLRYGADEDELARRMAVFGHRFGFCPEASVVHHHHMTVIAYLRTGWRQGGGSAQYWYKHNLGIGRDLIFLVLALLTLPLAFFAWGWAVPVFFLSLQLLAILFNEVKFKGKSLAVALGVLPLAFAYTVVKLVSVGRNYFLILTGLDPAPRESKRQWQERRKLAGK